MSYKARPCKCIWTKSKQITCSCVIVWRSTPSSPTAPSSTEISLCHEFSGCSQLTHPVTETISPFWTQFSENHQDFPTISKEK